MVAYQSEHLSSSSSSSSTTTTTTTTNDDDDSNHNNNNNNHNEHDSTAITSYPAFSEQPGHLLPLVIGCLSSYLQGRAMESDSTTRILQILVQCIKGILPDWCNNKYVIKRIVIIIYE